MFKYVLDGGPRLLGQPNFKILQLHAVSVIDIQRQLKDKQAVWSFPIQSYAKAQTRKVAGHCNFISKE